MVGKEIRLERIMNRNSGRTIIVPMDHGITLGPIPGLTDMSRAIDGAVNGGANAIIMHKGMVKAGHRGRGKDVGLIVHLSASTVLSPDPHDKVLVCTVEEAVRLGADAVSIHVNLGAPTDSRMLALLGEVARHCRDFGMPLLAMIYTRGEGIEDQFNVRYVKHAARVGAELGADIVKVNYTGTVDSFREVIAGCPVPVVIAGGEKMETDGELLTMVKESLRAGSCGVSIGRNVFQHIDPIAIIKAIDLLVHEDREIGEAMEFLKAEKKKDE
ncbi:MAG: 2-amino-3,7-dideoxy-D-threo-hept-6-ulosonate synthase [Candidatus Erginobacter occultus]|nr:2-amino-3,7-dideoxy-D-threo-hept-6-ulosonate synthase [Candidatus Erginobacter occultus]